jgi:hypothetical protein
MAELLFTSAAFTKLWRLRYARKHLQDILLGGAIKHARVLFIQQFVR